MCNCNRWIKKAVDEANSSTYKVKVGAVIFNKGKFISSGHNYGCRSIKHHLEKFRKEKTSIHAEVDAIIRARQDLKGASILVVRVNNQNQFRLSKPCLHCFSYLRHIKIKWCYYSINEFPYIERMRVE